jgi:hypothetical protein
MLAGELNLMGLGPTPENNVITLRTQHTFWVVRTACCHLNHLREVVSLNSLDAEVDPKATDTKVSLVQWVGQGNAAFIARPYSVAVGK